MHKHILNLISCLILRNWWTTRALCNCRVWSRASDLIWQGKTVCHIILWSRHYCCRRCKWYVDMNSTVLHGQTIVLLYHVLKIGHYRTILKMIDVIMVTVQTNRSMPLKDSLMYFKSLATGLENSDNMIVQVMMSFYLGNCSMHHVMIIYTLFDLLI